MANDGITWEGPPCPECGHELDPEPISTRQQMKIAYTCPTHGIVSVGDIFPEA